MTIESQYEKLLPISGSNPELDDLLLLENLPAEIKTSWGLEVAVDKDKKDHISINLANQVYEYTYGPISDIARFLRRMYVAAEYGQEIKISDYSDSKLPASVLESNMDIFLEKLKEANKPDCINHHLTMIDHHLVSLYGMKQ